ncbi:MAG: hypothetical protein E8D46_18400 [Nitrospira sp.]|nr:MAG: hypothetical protein E8D46_18400 [Nitrospira sp.]
MPQGGQQDRSAAVITGGDPSRNGHKPGQAVMDLAPQRAHQGGGAPRRSPDEQIADRVFRVKDPDSILLINKTQEGWMLSSMLFSFDKVMQRVRRGAGSRVPFDEAQSIMMKVEGVAQRIKDVLRRLGVSDVEYRWREPIGDIQERVKMASRRDAIVIVPRVQDTARLAPLIRGLDESLIRLRMESQSLETCMEELKTVATFVVDLHRIIQHGARLTNTPYEARGEVAKLVRQHDGRA